MKLQNLEVQELTMQEALAIEGGYSWAEFKQDVSDAWNDFKDGLSEGWAEGTK